MPEIVFLKDGKFDAVLQNDKEFCLVLDSKTKIVNLKLRMKFTDTVNERRKDTQMLGI